ncbi:hypothetical protein McanCB56680_004774 [Microsporum canis]
MPHCTETSSPTPQSSAYSGMTSGSSSDSSNPLDAHALLQFIQRQTRGADGDPWTPYSMSSSSSSSSTSSSS